jgi:hypothetical protein
MHFPPTLLKEKSMEPAKTSAELTDIVKQFDQSGLTQKVFCKNHNIKHSTFKNHVTRCRPAASLKTPSTLIPIKLSNSPSKTEHVCLSLPNGVQVKAPASTALVQSLLMQLIGGDNAAT